jgi:hypothetical protein
MTGWSGCISSAAKASRGGGLNRSGEPLRHRKPEALRVAQNDHKKKA